MIVGLTDRTKNMDLFKTKIPDKKLHDHFKQVQNNRLYEPVKDVIRSWGSGLLDRKGEQTKFINEF